MATEITRDLIGSTQLNTETSFGGKAERRVFVRIDPTDSFVSTTLLGRAIEKAALGQVAHPDDPSLPLIQARAKQVGNNTAEVILVYGRSRSSGGATDVPSGGSLVYQSRTRSTTRESHKIGNDWRDAEARDASNPTLAVNTNQPPRPVVFYNPEEEIIVPAVVTGASIDSITSKKALVGRVNSNVLNFGGGTWPANTMMLVGIDVDWQSQQYLGGFGPATTIIFLVKYRFRYRPDQSSGVSGWADEVVSFDSSLTPPQWVLTTALARPAVSMTGFPIA